METSNGLVPLPSSRRPWNKGKLIGPNASLRANSLIELQNKTGAAFDIVRPIDLLEAFPGIVT